MAFESDVEPTAATTIFCTSDCTAGHGTVLTVIGFDGELVAMYVGFAQKL